MAEVEMLIKTSQGWVCAAVRAGKVAALSLPRATREGARAACGRNASKGGHCAAVPPGLRMLARDLRRYFTGEAVDFRGYPVDISSLPPFLRRALEAARGIPYGQVRTYKWVAARAGRGRAARAAGQAMSRNPVALLVPCHRVVGSGGKLTGFGGGLPAKRALLELEGMVCHGDRVLMDSEQRRGRKRQ